MRKPFKSRSDIVDEVYGQLFADGMYEESELLDLTKIYCLENYNFRIDEAEDIYEYCMIKRCRGIH